VAIAAGGLALLAATLGRAETARREFDGTTLWLYVGALGRRRRRLCRGVQRRAAAVGRQLALAAALWGASDVTIKAGSGELIDHWLLALLTPEALVITVLSLIGLVVSARSLQLGPAIAVIALTSAAANVVTIAAGPIVFSEPLPDGTLALIARLVGFTAVIVGSVLTPGPAAEVPDEPCAVASA
jgi:hypothetical protein